LIICHVPKVLDQEPGSSKKTNLRTPTPRRDYDAPIPEGTFWALLEIDLKNAFNEALRQAAFDVITGKAAAP